MNRLVVLFVLVVFGSAAGAAELPYKKFVAGNAASLNKLTVGMTKEQVMAVMGNHTSKVPDGDLSNPYRVESFQRGSSTYEVLYFLTRVHPPFTPILDNQSMPVVLKDGVVSGWGRNALSSINSN